MLAMVPPGATISSHNSKVELMIEFGVAVATDATYTVKRIDNDFFESI